MATFQGQGYRRLADQILHGKNQKELTSIVPLPTRAAHNLQILGFFYLRMPKLNHTPAEDHPHAYFTPSRLEPEHILERLNLQYHLFAS